MGANQVVLQADDNLQGGQTYTFSFTGCNLLSFFVGPSADNILEDLTNHAPTFISSPQVNIASQITSEYVYNITFNYTGDGSDIVSDVANEIIDAANQGSNDCLSFEQATTGTSGIAALSDVSTATTAISTAAGSAVGNVAGGLTQGITSGVTSNLGMSGWVVVILVILGVLAYFSAATGIRAPRTS